MRLNKYEMEMLRRLLGRIDIKQIPEECFLAAALLHERLDETANREEEAISLPPEDVLNALLADVVGDQVRRALELGYAAEEVEAAVNRGLSHGQYEFKSMKGDPNER